jgi:hypothetical protein
VLRREEPSSILAIDDLALCLEWTREERLVWPVLSERLRPEASDLGLLDTIWRN